jgi:serine-type D-Ala-D-Ala carboxypeptidase (penicillin-binding protein 5/6)
MRLPARLIVIAVGCAVIAGGALAWTSAVAGPKLVGPAFAHTSIAVRPKKQTASPQAHRAVVPKPVPVIKVTGAPKGLLAKGAVLADASTGQILYERDANAERPMASITKVMTALMVLDAGQLNRKIRVPGAVLNYVWQYGASSAGLHPGDWLTVQDLLEAMLLPSGADAAYTLANAYGPGLPAFIAKMNATASSLGMTRTHFTSPDGLPYPTETSTFSTPLNLLTLGLLAMKSPVFRSIVDQTFYHLPKGPGHHSYWWDNTNELLGNYAGAVGIKTGFTDDAGHCLLFEAIRRGRVLIGVVLGSPASGPGAGADDAARLLNWGFSLQSTTS